MRVATFLIIAFVWLFSLPAGPALAGQEAPVPQTEAAVKTATDLRVQAATLAKAGDFIIADEMFNRSIEVARSVDDPKSRDWTLLFIATAQARAGSIYAGIETANSIETETYQYWALGDIAPMQAAGGDLPGALETAGAIPEGDTQARTYGGIAIQQARFGDVMQAGIIADKITEPSFKFQAYVAIIRAMAQAGR
jgi:hypothetical protein